jgi:hypothetical protein
MSTHNNAKHLKLKECFKGQYIFSSGVSREAAVMQ